MSQPTLNADGSSTVQNDDGSITTAWPDGTASTTWPDQTVRVDYPDRSYMVTYPDGRVLNGYPDGSQTLNDANGVALDPATGQPLNADPGPVIDPESDDTVAEILHGGHKLSSLAEAVGILGRIEVVEAVAEPIDGLLAVAVMSYEVWKALEAANRAYASAGHCYGLMYGALDLAGPDYPSGSWSLDSEETIAIKKGKFADGVNEARTELADGANGVLLRNKILLRTAHLGSDPAAMIDELWKASCSKADNAFYADHMRLMWPSTGITER
jgi:hypothetical protein